MAVARGGAGLAAAVVALGLLAGCSSTRKATPAGVPGGTTTTATTVAPATTVVPATTAAPARATDATAVAQAMIKAGLPASVSKTYTAADDPNHLLGRQGGYTSKVSIQDKRLPAGDLANSSTAGGASLECYPDNSGAAKRYTYLQAFSGSLIGDGYDYLAGPCVLRVDNAVTPDNAAQYQNLFKAAVG